MSEMRIGTLIRHDTDYDCPLCNADIYMDDDGNFFCSHTDIEFSIDELEEKGGCKICHGKGLTYQLDENGICSWEGCEEKFEQHRRCAR